VVLCSLIPKNPSFLPLLSSPPPLACNVPFWTCKFSSAKLASSVSFFFVTRGASLFEPRGTRSLEDCCSHGTGNCPLLSVHLDLSIFPLLSCFKARMHSKQAHFVPLFGCHLVRFHLSKGVSDDPSPVIPLLSLSSSPWNHLPPPIGAIIPPQPQENFSSPLPILYGNIRCKKDFSTLKMWILLSAFPLFYALCFL